MFDQAPGRPGWFTCRGPLPAALQGPPGAPPPLFRPVAGNRWASESGELWAETRNAGLVLVPERPLRQTGSRAPAAFVPPPPHRAFGMAGRAIARAPADVLVVRIEGLRHEFSALDKAVVVEVRADEVDGYTAPAGFVLLTQRPQQYRVFSRPLSPGPPQPPHVVKPHSRSLAAVVDNFKEGYTTLQPPVRYCERMYAQKTVMNDWSAADHVAAVRGSTSGMEWEWLHLIAASLGGPTTQENLVAGRKDTNTIMGVFEHELLRVAQDLPPGESIWYYVQALLIPGSHVAHTVNVLAVYPGGRLQWQRLDALDPRPLERPTVYALKAAARRESGVALDMFQSPTLHLHRVRPTGDARFWSPAPPFRPSWGAWHAGGGFPLQPPSSPAPGPPIPFPLPHGGLPPMTPLGKPPASPGGWTGSPIYGSPGSPGTPPAPHAPPTPFAPSAGAWVIGPGGPPQTPLRPPPSPGTPPPVTPPRRLRGAPFR